MTSTCANECDLCETLKEKSMCVFHTLEKDLWLMVVMGSLLFNEILISVLKLFFLKKWVNEIKC